MKNDGTVLAWETMLTARRTFLWAGQSLAAVAAGNLHSLALKATALSLRGDTTRKARRPYPQARSNVVAIAGGAHHSPALSVTGH